MLYGLGAGNHFPCGEMISLWIHHFDAADKYSEDGRAVKRFLCSELSSASSGGWISIQLFRF